MPLPHTETSMEIKLWECISTALGLRWRRVALLSAQRTVQGRLENLLHQVGEDEQHDGSLPCLCRGRQLHVH